MRMFSERTQVLLSPQQLARLKRLARRESRSVGAVIRDAVDAYTVAAADGRRDAIQRLMTLGAPVDDWSVMKDQIARGARGELGRPGER
jgi:predicted transcriptional regulator